jgi:hypothetical protein
MIRDHASCSIELALILAFEVANQDLDLAEIEKEFDGIGDKMAEPWK